MASQKSWSVRKIIMQPMERPKEVVHLGMGREFFCFYMGAAADIDVTASLRF